MSNEDEPAPDVCDKLPMPEEELAVRRTIAEYMRAAVPDALESIRLIEENVPRTGTSLDAEQSVVLPPLRIRSEIVYVAEMVNRLLGAINVEYSRFLSAGGGHDVLAYFAPRANTRRRENDLFGRAIDASEDFGEVMRTIAERWGLYEESVVWANRAWVVNPHELDALKRAVGRMRPFLDAGRVDERARGVTDSRVSDSGISTDAAVRETTASTSILSPTCQDPNFPGIEETPEASDPAIEPLATAPLTPSPPAKVPKPMSAENRALAVALRFAREGEPLIITKIAEEADCSASYLHRCKRFKVFLRSCEGTKRDLPRGRADQERGIEAWDS